MVAQTGKTVNDLVSSYISALRFFTRLPLPRGGGGGAPDDPVAEPLAYPMAGLTIGLVLGVVWWLTVRFLPALPAAGVTIAAGLLLTGALHEDGLADCADGLAGSADREKALKIMRDSRIGVFGAAALILSVAFRWTALASLSAGGGFAALIVSHTIGRAAIPAAYLWSRYARDDGVAAGAGQIGGGAFWLQAAIACFVALGLAGMAGIAAAIAGFTAAGLMLWRLNKRLGGYTGDGLGAMEQCAEIAVLLLLAGWWA